MTAKSKAAPLPWPRLSRQCTEIRHPEWCQSCGTHGADTGAPLQFWQEHDECDGREAILVALCAVCAKALIDPHPRLYRRLEENEPWPGVTAVCVSCRWRRELRCGHPDAVVRGGKGLAYPEPHAIHVSMRQRSKSFWMSVYPGPVERCSGREEMTIGR